MLGTPGAADTCVKGQCGIAVPHCCLSLQRTGGIPSAHPRNSSAPSLAVQTLSLMICPPVSPKCRVLTELVSKMKDMQMDKSELGCLRAIVLFNPGKLWGCRGGKFPVKTQGSRLLQVTSRRAVALSIRTVSRSAPVSGCLAKEGPNPLPPTHLVTASSRKVSAATSPPPELSLVQMPRACPAPQKWSHCGRRSTPRWKPTRSRSTPSSQGGECPQWGSSPPAWGWVQQRARGRS